MKFFVGNGERFRRQLQDFPWAKNFLSSQILVIGMNDGGIITTCGIRSVLNILTLYVSEGYRGQGIGSRILRKSIEVARKRNLSFIVLCVLLGNIPAFQLYSEFGFRKIVRFDNFTIMIFPLNTRGELTYGLLNLIFSRLPNRFITIAANWIEKATLSEN